MSVSAASSPASIESVTVRGGDRPSCTWGGLVHEHRAYLEEKKDNWLVFLGDGHENQGEMMFKPYTHRWTQGYTERQYAQIHDFIRGAREEYDDPYIVFLPALTASTITPTGQPRPPLDHFDQLKNSWARGVRYELSHSMNADRKKDDYPARDWEYLQIWEPTTDTGRAAGGYAHMHPVVVCDGKVEKDRFRSVVEKHVEKCDWAGLDAHSYEETDIRKLNSLNNPAAYLFKYLGKSWKPDDSEPFQHRFDALLYETDYRRFQPSQGAQRWMKREETEALEEWLFAGVGNGDDVAYLEEFDDAHEFAVAHETGVKSYLSGRSGSEQQPKLMTDSAEFQQDECPHDTWHRGRCISCGLSEQSLISTATGSTGPPG